MNEIVNISGVCAVIVGPDGKILSTRENTSKRVTGKVAGMLTIPMETQEPGESDFQTTLRLLEEEAAGLQIEILTPESLKDGHLCRVQMTPGVWVNIYELHTTNKRGRGSQFNDVDGIYWHSASNILQAPLYTLHGQQTPEIPENLHPEVKSALHLLSTKLSKDTSINLGRLGWRPGTWDGVYCYRLRASLGSLYRPPVLESPSGRLPSIVFDYLDIIGNNQNSILVPKRYESETAALISS